MVPDKFNMVDMGGIDLIMMQGEAVSGLYEKLMAAISNCRYQCLYNWLFDGVLIPPTYVQIEVDDGEVYLNEGVSVTSDDVIHIYSIEPPAPEPEIIPLLAEENGVYNVPTGKDGFNPVTVDVPSYTPVITPLSITENGTYTAPSGTDGYSPITVNVSGGSVDPSLPDEYQEVAYIQTYGQEWIDTNISLYKGDIISLEADRGSSTSAQTIIGNRTDSSARWDAGWESGAFYATNACYFCSATLINNLNIKMLLGIYPDSSTGFRYGAYRYSSEYPFVGNLYMLRVYHPVLNSGLTELQLIAKFIPCYRKSDNVIGFYDSVNSVFYTNQGSGAFGKGPDIN